MLLIMYLSFPVVSTRAFRAFSCEEFDDGSRYLRADYSVDCDSDEHSGNIALAWLAIIAYPICMPAITAYLLYLERDALRNETETKRSAALAFLFREYAPEFFWCARTRTRCVRARTPLMKFVASSAPLWCAGGSWSRSRAS